MSAKRSRTSYEADHQAQPQGFVLFGTPLPQDPEVRDDGSYVPVWQQEVRDERGRKRLHGAFTGGWSAGYFNTVGSKEGWTPSTFVSSRTNRRKDDAKSQQRPEDYMDEEDLEDAEEAKRIQTSQSFAGLGLTEHDSSQAASRAGLFRVEGETMGTRLLRKMGWKDGQGIGPKVRRAARLDVGKPGDGKTTFLFAPDNVTMIRFLRKKDHKGLDYEAESRLVPADALSKEDQAGVSDDDDDNNNNNDDDDMSRPAASLSFISKKKRAKQNRGGIGIGVLNDTGSDDEDPYAIGPRISYNRVIGGDKKKKKKGGDPSMAQTPVNPLLKSKPVFLSKKAALGRAGFRLRKCHDGRLPLEGFVFGQEADPLISEINSEGKYAPPEIPPDWKSKKLPGPSGDQATYVSAADAAKASKLDPNSRAAVLGERQLPGKSVFDFLSASARDRLIAATGRTDLPEARGEVPAGHALSEGEKLQELLKGIPNLDKETAVAAISRGASGGAPYRDNEAKRSRYRAYLEYQAGLVQALPPKPLEMSNDAWLREFHEFYSCARIFKPMSGFMASRFTTSSSASKLAAGSSGQVDSKDLVTRPPPKPQDPAEEAAKMGMYGHLTRSIQDFFPSRLLCKRFNVKPPTNVQPDQDVEAGRSSKSSASNFGIYDDNKTGRGTPSNPEHPVSVSSNRAPAQSNPLMQSLGAEPNPGDTKSVPPAVDVVDANKNEALEGKRAGEEVFRAVFGDSGDDEE